MEWRERIGADKMLDEWDAPEVLRKYYAGGSYGVDREGSPVWYDLPSCQDFKGFFFHAIDLTLKVLKYLCIKHRDQMGFFNL